MQGCSFFFAPEARAEQIAEVDFIVIGCGHVPSGILEAVPMEHPHPRRRGQLLHPKAEWLSPDSLSDGTWVHSCPSGKGRGIDGAFQKWP